MAEVYWSGHECRWSDKHSQYLWTKTLLTGGCCQVKPSHYLIHGRLDSTSAYSFPDSPHLSKRHFFISSFLYKELKRWIFKYHLLKTQWHCQKMTFIRSTWAFLLLHVLLNSHLLHHHQLLHTCLLLLKMATLWATIHHKTMTCILNLSHNNNPNVVIKLKEETSVLLLASYIGKDMHLFMICNDSLPCSMVGDKKHQDLICWNNAGTSFLITNSKSFSQQVLPEYFKHGNFSSFVRQLNM